MLIYVYSHPFSDTANECQILFCCLYSIKTLYTIRKGMSTGFNAYSAPISHLFTGVHHTIYIVRLHLFSRAPRRTVQSLNFLDRQIISRLLDACIPPFLKAALGKNQPLDLRLFCLANTRLIPPKARHTTAPSRNHKPTGSASWNASQYTLKKSQTMPVPSKMRVFLRMK